jgi:hypothetical protein
MTNSFGITPQRQLRDTFVKPEQKDRAQPATPEMTPQRRGGQLLDFQNFVPDQALEQRVQSIENFVNQANKLTGTLVKQESEKQVADAERLFDKVAQYQLDSLEIGEVAKQLRKKGENNLADEVVRSNPWFRFGWLQQQASFAGQDTIYRTYDYVNANMGTLSQIEDPTEVSRKVNEYATKYYEKNYPGIPNQMYSANVAPILSKGLPRLLEGIRDEHRKYQLNFLTQKALQSQYSAVSEWTRNTNDYKSVKGLLESRILLNSNNDLLRNKLLATKRDAINSGLTYDQYRSSVEIPFLKKFPIDLNNDGISDIEDKGLLTEFKRALANVELDGLPGQKLLDQIDPETNLTFRSLLTNASNQAIQNEVRMNTALQQSITLDNKRLKDDGQLHLRMITEGLDTSEAYLAKRDFLDKVIEAQKTGGTVKMHIYNTETGVVELADVPIPKFLDIEDFESNVIDKQIGATVDIDTYNADLARITTIGAQNPNADFSDILSNYEKGGKQYNKLAEKIQKIKTNFAAKDWNPSLKQLGTKMEKIAKTINEESLENYFKENSITSKRQRKVITNNFKNAYSNYQKSEAYDLAIKYGRNRIADATAEELQDPTWWNSVAEDLSKHLQSDSYFTDPNQFTGANNIDSEKTLMVYQRNDNGAVVGNVDRIYTNEDFLSANSKLVKSEALTTMFKSEPMINTSTVENLLSALYTDKNSFTPTAVNDLNEGFKLAKRLNEGLTLENFLKGQFSDGVFQVDSGDLEFNSQKFNQLRNKLMNVTVNRSTIIKDHGETTTGGNSGISFHIESKTSGAKKPLSINIPVKMQITNVAYDEGNLGHYSEAVVLNNGNGLKKGDIIRLSHAQNFKVKVGEVYQPGQVWGTQHSQSSYSPSIDGGTGFHLFLDIRRKNEYFPQYQDPLPQHVTNEIFNKFLKNRLSP